MNILISGATGFIGRHLAKSLTAQHFVYCITRNQSPLITCMQPVFADLSKRNFSSSLPYGIDCVVHLAQSTKYRDFPEGVADLQRVNVNATVELLEWSRKTKVKHFIYTSSANVYSPSVNRLLETSETIPSSFYGATKLCAEHLARQYQSFFQVDILRLFTVFGLDQKNMLISNIIDRIKSGQEITLAEGSGVFLTPIFLEDVINIINKIISKSKATESRLMNVCGNRVTSLAEIVKILENLLHQSAFTRRIDDKAPHFIGNNGLLQKYIGKYQFINLERALERTI